MQPVSAARQQLKADGPIRAIAAAVAALPEDQDGYWPEERELRQGHSPKYYQYPAMMVPAMQGAIMDIILTHYPRLNHLADPFMGSGTVLAEGLWRGMDFTGQDLNPLSLLICKVRAGPYHPELLARKCGELSLRIANGSQQEIDVEFPGVDKWFKPEVKADLCRIRRAIREEKALWCRRFFWLAFAETVRQVSNSRSSTVKLHILGPADLAKHNPNAIGIFAQVLTRFQVSYRECAKELENSKLLERGRHKSTVSLRLADTSRSFKHEDSRPNFLVTSPPYGDNTSTVPYGQAAYLPLNWVDLNDIDPSVSKSLIENTHLLDRLSLGGTRQKVLEHADALAQRYSTVRTWFDHLKAKPRDHRIRGISFALDLERAIKVVATTMAPKSWMMWTVANRKLGGMEMPLDAMLKEMLASQGFSHVETKHRTIKRKRMAANNSLGQTMSREQVVLFQRGFEA